MNAALVDNERLTFAFTAPEGRGPLEDSHPSSIWQLRELHRWCKKHDCRRAALNQCELGPSPSTAPLGILMHSWSSGTASQNSPLKAGWPRHSPPLGRHYFGPLPRKCTCGTRHIAPVRQSDDDVSVSPSVATALFLAQLTLRPHIRARARVLGLLKRASGFDSLVPDITARRHQD